MYLGLWNCSHFSIVIASYPRVGAVVLMLTPVPGLVRNKCVEDVNALVSIESTYNLCKTSQL
jgi:hypothetical protein